MHSFHALLADLSPVALNDVSVGGSESVKLVTTPTPAQQKAFDLLDINPTKLFPAAGRWDSENRVPDTEKLVFLRREVQVDALLDRRPGCRPHRESVA